MKQLEKEFGERFTSDQCYLANQFREEGNCAQKVWQWIEENFIPKDEMWARFSEALVTIIEQNKKIREMEEAIESIRRDLW